MAMKFSPSRLFTGMLLLAGCGLAAALAVFAFLGADRAYVVQEGIFRERFRRFDGMIEQAALRHGVSPSLIKAVIWRETRFKPDVAGSRGERGLMQITEAAAKDWVDAEKIETFVVTDLFDAKTNIDAGAWYLARGLRHWAHKNDPVPFALAEYNAGRTRVRRWERDSGRTVEFTAQDLQQAMDFPATKQYVGDIVERHRRYLERGEFGESPGESALRVFSGSGL